MRTVIPINRDWLYKPHFSQEDDLNKPAGKEGYQQVCLPHTNIELPYNYFDDAAFCFISCYKRRLSLEPRWQGQRLFLDFEGVMNFARVFINGEPAGEHRGGYTAFSVEITDLVRFDGENEVTVAVDSTERPDTPPFGGRIDYLTYGGIYREVQLRVVPPVHLKHVFLSTPDVQADSAGLAAEITPDGIKGGDPHEYTTRIVLKDGETILARQQETIPDGRPARLRLHSLSNIQLWSLNSPKLYSLDCALLKGTEEIDHVEVRVGFRDIRLTSGGCWLNGEKIKLRGLNRHQSFPYAGYAMPKRAQRKDADILKYELGLTMVRTSHYPQSRHFLDRCDEIGLLVFEEIPGWQHIGSEEWQDQAVRDVEQMILTDRNHPSIFIWGVRINESPDHHNLYTRTNDLARRLDPTRPTGGVRFIPGSEMLEDVYTMNDFIHDNGYGKYLAKVIRDFKTYDHLQGQDGEAVVLRDPRDVTGLSHDVPYMVTEYNGHVYPTKRFDQEERLVEHALRHARVQNALYADDRILGAVGWCAFDYNTHADFGAGDKICYHGVMDMFRIPKMAAYAYRSQKSPGEEVVMEPATCWARGERSVGGVIPLVIFTNCDEVTFLYGSERIGSYKPDRLRYPALPHPPVVIDDMTGAWGMKWEDATFIGWIGGKEVIRRSFSRNAVPARLEMLADDTVLKAGDWDTTRVTVSVKDQMGNVMPFLMESLVVTVEGAGELIGPGQLSLIGGQAAFWIRSKGDAGEILVSASCPRLNRTEHRSITVEN